MLCSPMIIVIEGGCGCLILVRLRGAGGVDCLPDWRNIVH